MAGYVLIVERDPHVQRKLGDALREAGYEHGSEADAAWALRSIDARPPDAVIVGDRTPDSGAFHFAEGLRRAGDSRATPIVFVAGHDRGASHRAEARRRFAPAAFLEMPLDAGALLSCLATLISPLGDPSPLPLSPVPIAAVPGDPEQQRERREVERRARRMGADAESRGTLKRTPFAHLLRRLYAECATGSLLLLHQATKKIVGFHDGYPVSVRSNVLAECLGQILVSQKLITPPILSASVARMQREKRRQGEILVEMGALSPFNLERALMAQIEAKLFEIFSWRDGQFMFKEGAPTDDGGPRLERPPATLILEGIRRHYDEDRQRAVLAELGNQRLCFSPDPILRLQEMTSDDAEGAFVRSIEGNTAPAAITKAAAIGPVKARLLIVALFESGMIDVQEGKPRQRSNGGSGAHHATPPAVLNRPAVPTPTGSRDGSGPYEGLQLSLVAQALRTQSPYWALGVEPDASAAAIDDAYETLARRFHADRYRNAGEDDRRIAREIFDRLGEAHRLLSEPARRRSSEGADGAGEAVEARPPSARRKSSDGAGTAAVSGSFATGDSLPAGAVRAIFDAGMEHLRARRHHEAVDAFRQAARLSPGAADFRAALGWALFVEAPADTRAGRAALAELRRALQLDPHNRPAMQYLARIYEHTAQPGLAIKELEKIVALDPSATDAADELRRLRDER